MIQSRSARAGVLAIGTLAVVAGAARATRVGTPAPAWPAAGSVLTPVPSEPPAPGPPLRVYLDAGHGAEDNHGNRGAFCEPEEVFTVDLATFMATALERRGGFVTRVSRTVDGPRVAYPDRVADAERWGADAFVSLHSDVRGTGQPWRPSAAGGATCRRSHDAPGFSILVADAHHPSTPHSTPLARGLASALRRSGLPAYDGRHYGAVYAGDARAPGVFFDRHEPGARIFVLWRPRVPAAILIETHHALDDREVERWRGERPRRVLTAALASALRATLLPRGTGDDGQRTD
ncbi:MAG: N-acetylmuramoyl-L-alanine amidase [Myxococcota bacterium]